MLPTDVPGLTVPREAVVPISGWAPFIELRLVEGDHEPASPAELPAPLSWGVAAVAWAGAQLRRAA